jgi:hypothetical protein
MLERIANGLAGAATLADALSDAQIRDFVRRVSTIVTGTLGLSQQGFRADFLAMLAAARTALRSGNAAMSNEAAAVRAAMACLLARLEADIYPRFPVLDLDPGRLAELVIRALRDTPLPGRRRRLSVRPSCARGSPASSNAAFTDWYLQGSRE